MKKFILFLVALLSIMTVNAADYYYRGAKNGWGATKMDVSTDGYYSYYQASGGDHQFKIATTADGWDYNHSYVTKNFNNTDISDIGDYGQDNCYIWASGDYYILVYHPNTEINKTSNPIICASTTLPDDSPAVTPDPEPDPEPTTYTVYFDNNGTGWTKVNAYCWNASGNNSWPGEAMTPVEGHDGFYSYTTNAAYNNIIFNDGSVQTVDLIFPKDDNNLFKITGESGGQKTGTWSVYEAPDPNEPVVSFTNLNPTAELGATIKPEANAENIENPTYVYTVSYEGGEAITVNATEGYVLEKYGSYAFTVVATGDEDKSATATYVVNVKPIVVAAGTSELCHDHSWSATALDNAMYPVNGVYTITYENVPAGDYEFKVVYLDAWLGADKVDAEISTPGFGGSGDENISFTLAFPTDITISYNPTTEKIILIGEGLSQFGEFVVESYTLCGSKVIFGGDADSDPTLAANDMTENNGVWTKTYTDVLLEVGDYKYKVAANHKWNGAQYPSNGDMKLTISEAGKYNLTFTYDPNKAEGEKLICDVEKIETPALGITATWSIEENAVLGSFSSVTVTFSGTDSVGRVLGSDATTITSLVSSTPIFFSVGENDELIAVPNETASGVLGGSKNGFSYTYSIQDKAYKYVQDGKYMLSGKYRIIIPAGKILIGPNRSGLPKVYTTEDYVLNFTIENSYIPPVELEEVAVPYITNPANKIVSEIGSVVVTFPDVAAIEVMTPVSQTPDPATWAFLNQTLVSGGAEVAAQPIHTLVWEKTAENAVTFNIQSGVNVSAIGTYYISIPAGLIYFAETTVNKEMKLYYTIAPATPVITVDVEKATAAITCATDGATIKYAIVEDAEEVSAEKYQEYTGAFDLNKEKASYTIYAYSEANDAYAAMGADPIQSEVINVVYKVNNGNVVVGTEIATITDVYVQNNTIIADGEFQIFSITGQNVTDMNGSLTRGAYIVRTATGVAKVMIK